jgi:hypothetical protein
MIYNCVKKKKHKNNIHNYYNMDTIEISQQQPEQPIPFKRDRKEYFRKYQQYKYHNDAEYREKKKEQVRIRYVKNKTLLYNLLNNIKDST